MNTPSSIVSRWRFLSKPGWQAGFLLACISLSFAADPPASPRSSGNSSAFIEKHLESRLPELSLSTVRDPNAGGEEVSLSAHLDAFLKEQVQAVHRTGWKVRIDRASTSASGLWPLSSRPDPSTKTVRISVTSSDISRLSEKNNYAFSYFWLGLLHELENARHATEFVRLSSLARQGRISRRDFVEREIHLECISFSRALKTYRQVLLPLVKKNSGVQLNDFTTRWPARLTAKEARQHLNWSPIQAHYEEWYEKVSGSKTRPSS